MGEEEETYEDQFNTDEFNERENRLINSSYQQLHQMRSESINTETGPVYQHFYQWYAKKQQQLQQKTTVDTSEIQDTGYTPQLSQHTVVDVPQLSPSVAVPEQTGGEDDMLHSIEEYDEMLIDCVRKYEVIWVTSGRGYKDNVRKKNAWAEIGKILQLDRK